MVLRIDAVERRLLRLESVISELSRLSEMDLERFREDLSEMWKVERGLQLGAEVLLDIGNHILAAHFGASPDGYRKIFERMADHKVISRSLASRLSGLAGFRNVLVHDYLDLDPVRVLDNFKRAPQQFSEFAQEIRDWLEDQPA